jgi:hypothetical protein
MIPSVVYWTEFFLLLETNLQVVVDGFVPTPTLGLVSGRGTLDHWEITEQGCLQIAQEALLEEGFLSTRTKTSDLGASSLVESAFGSGTSANDFLEAVEEIQEANSAVDDDSPLETAAHMDAENFIEGNERLLNLRTVVINQILSKEFVRARVAAGQFCHTLQDFYSHSNWVELGYRTPHPDLAKVGRVPGTIAPPNVPTCRDCSKTTLFVTRYLVECRNNLLRGSPKYLTSGYYVTQTYYVVGRRVYQERLKPDASSLNRTAQDQGKCSHGGISDKSREDTATGGINKDAMNEIVSPHWYLHKDAAKVAIQGTANFLEDIRHEVGNFLFLRFLGLDYGASLSFAIDTTESMRDDIEEIRKAVNNIIDSRRIDGRAPSDYILAEFNDPDIGPVHVTSDPDEFKRIFAGIAVHVGLGNNDKAEMAIGGLLLALQKSRPRSTVYLFTDGDAKDWERHKEALTLIYDKKITVYVVRITHGTSDSTIGMSSHVYSLISEKSGGQMFHGNKTNIRKLLQMTANFQATSDVTLLSADSSTPAWPPHGHIWAVLIDSSVREITVSVSGSDPSVLLFDNFSNIVSVSQYNFGTSVVVNWVQPTMGRVTVQVLTESSYTLRVKALSSLDLQYRFVVSGGIDHFGYFPVRGLPRAGDSLHISLTVIGLTSDQRVKRLFLQREDGAVINTLPVEKLNDTKYRFMTVDAVTIPEVPFQVGLEGREVSTGISFRRVDVTVVTPTRVRVVLQSQSDIVIKQGTTSTVSFMVQNGPDAPSDVFSVNITDELNLAWMPSHANFSLGSHDNISINVSFRVPHCFWFNGINTVTVAVNSVTSDAFASITMATFIDSQVCNMPCRALHIDVRLACCFLFLAC